MDSFMEAFAPQLMIAVNAAVMTSILFMCKKKKPPAAPPTAPPTADAAGDKKPEEKKEEPAKPAGTPKDDKKEEKKEKSKKEGSKKSAKKSVKEEKSKKDSKKSKKSEKEKKEGKSPGAKSDKKESGVGKSPVAKSGAKDAAEGADKEKPEADKEKEKKEGADDEKDKEKKEGGDEKKEGGDEKKDEKKEGEDGGDKLPQKTTDLPTADGGQMTAMQILKKELNIDPPELRFSKDGGIVKMILTNTTGARVAVKIKCSDNDLFRVNPVFSFIEKDAKFVIEVSRNSGSPKPDKLAVVSIEVADDAKDPQTIFKDTPAEKHVTASVPMFAN